MTARTTKRRQLKLPATYAIAANNAGDRIVVLGRSVVIANPENMERIATGHPLSHPSYASFSADSSRLAVKSTSGQIVVIDSTSCAPIVDFKNKKEGEGAEAIFSPCDKFLIDASWSGNIYIRNAKNGTVKTVHSDSSEMITAVSSCKSKTSWLFLHQPKATSRTAPPASPYLTIRTWPFDDAAVRRIDPRQNQLHAASISPSGDIIAVIGYTNSTEVTTLRLLDASNGKLLRAIEYEFGGTAYSLKWSPDGELLGTNQREKIVIYSVPKLSEWRSFPIKYASDIEISKDRSYVVLGGWSGGLITRL